MANLEHTADEEFDDLGGEFEDAELPPEEPEVSAEDRARAQGWRPLAEYRGPPGRWSNAEEFLARGEADWSILRAQNRKMSEKLARLEPEIESLRNTSAEQSEALKAAMNLARRADQRGYDRAVADLKTKQREAVQSGDEVAYDQVEEQLKALETTRAEVEAPPEPRAPAPKGAPPPPQEVIDFRRDNPWFDRDERLRKAMIAMHQAEIDAEGRKEGAGLQAQLDRALNRMHAAYPETRPAGDLTDLDYEEEEELPPEPAPRPRPRTRVPAVAAPGPAARPRPGPGARSDPFSSIPDEAERADVKRAFESIRRQDPGYTAAEHMAIYDDPHVDVLELRRQRKK
jgi:hypothetical protein